MSLTAPARLLVRLAGGVRTGLAWLHQWPARAPRTGRLAVVPAFLLAAIVVLFYSQQATRLWLGTKPLNDFFALWSWSAMIHAVSHPLDIYMPERVQAFLHTEKPDFRGHYPFAYPPSFLLLIWPLALVRRSVAYAVWVAVSLTAYLAATAQGRWWRPIVLVLILAPATALAVDAGQDGLLVAALLVGGCRLLPRRPMLAGVLLGLVSCKPQFGLLVPVALLAAREWRAIAAATATVLASVLASAAAFGWAMWGRWVVALWGLAAFVAGRAHLLPLAPTLTANLHLLGAGPLLRALVQTAAALLAGSFVWSCWRRGTGRLPNAVLQVGTFLATPYAFFYDLPIVTGALVEIVLERIEADAVFGAGELLVLFAAMLLPGLMADFPGPVPWSGFVLPPLFALVVARALRAGVGQAAGTPTSDKSGQRDSAEDNPPRSLPQPAPSACHPA